MNSHQIDNQQQYYYKDDEIELFDLFKTLWKWRLFIIGITVVSVLFGLVFVMLKPVPPVTYTATVDIQIGKVANVNIESAGDTYVFLQSDAYTSGNEKLKHIEIAINNFQDIEYPGPKNKQFQLNQFAGFEYTVVLTISYTDLDAEKALKVVQEGSNKLQQRHEKIYNNALAKFKNFKPQFEKLPEAAPRELSVLWIDSYTYPTRVIKAARTEVAQVRSNRSNIIVPILAAITAFFLSCFMALLIEGVRNRIAEERSK